jgi:beta-fructofuranosidase
MDWQVQEPFYSPDLYFTHECPDLFKMGDWWYLIFSEFSDKVRTRYRMSRSLKGPWSTPRRDDFDGHAFYAAKSASDGKSRFLFGWNPTRSGAKDDGDWDWGGNLVVHELVQEKDGQLGVKIPQSITDAFASSVPLSFESGVGRFQYSNGALQLDARETFAAVAAGAQARLCRISATAKFQRDTKAFGLMFRTSNNFDSSYYVRIEPQNSRLVFDMWPRVKPYVLPQMVELERPLNLSVSDSVRMTLLLDGNKGVAYVNDIVAMNFRAYDLPEGNWGFFATDGLVTFSNIGIATTTEVG